MPDEQWHQQILNHRHCAQTLFIWKHNQFVFSDPPYSWKHDHSEKILISQEDWHKQHSLCFQCRDFHNQRIIWMCFSIRTKYVWKFLTTSHDFSIVGNFGNVTLAQLFSNSWACCLWTECQEGPIDIQYIASRVHVLFYLVRGRATKCWHLHWCGDCSPPSGALCDPWMVAFWMPAIIW